MHSEWHLFPSCIQCIFCVYSVNFFVYSVCGFLYIDSLCYIDCLHTNLASGYMHTAKTDCCFNPGRDTSVAASIQTMCPEALIDHYSFQIFDQHVYCHLFAIEEATYLKGKRPFTWNTEGFRLLVKMKSAKCRVHLRCN